MCLSITRLSFTAGISPEEKPSTTSRPSQAMQRSDSSSTSPPTDSQITSAPRPGGQLAHALVELAARDHAFVGAVRAAQRELVLAARAGDHARAERVRDLHERDPDAAGRGLHQHALAALHARAIDQRQVRGLVRDAERDRVAERHAVGQRLHAATSATTCVA